MESPNPKHPLKEPRAPLIKGGSWDFITTYDWSLGVLKGSWGVLVPITGPVALLIVSLIGLV